MPITSKPHRMSSNRGQHPYGFRHQPQAYPRSPPPRAAPLPPPNPSQRFQPNPSYVGPSNVPPPRPDQFRDEYREREPPRERRVSNETRREWDRHDEVHQTADWSGISKRENVTYNPYDRPPERNSRSAWSKFYFDSLLFASSDFDLTFSYYCRFSTASLSITFRIISSV